MLERAYCKLISVDIAAILRDAGWRECFCHCASDLQRMAGYCCEKCGGRMTYWEPPKPVDDFLMTL